MTAEPIDHRILSVCTALNALPGVTTYASCSGHADDHDRPTGPWYAAFAVDHPTGAVSLQAVACAAAVSSLAKPAREAYDAYLECVPDWRIVPSGLVHYILRGEGDLDAFAVRLAQATAGRLTIPALMEESR